MNITRVRSTHANHLNYGALMICVLISKSLEFHSMQFFELPQLSAERVQFRIDFIFSAPFTSEAERVAVHGLREKK